MLEWKGDITSFYFRWPQNRAELAEHCRSKTQTFLKKILPAQLFKKLELEEVVRGDLTQKAASVRDTAGQKGEDYKLQING